MLLAFVYWLNSTLELFLMKILVSFFIDDII